MKKIILIIVSLTILSLPVLAIINGMIPGDRIGDKSKYEIGVKLEKGWNLIVDGTPDLTQNRLYRGSDILPSNIKAMYGYDTKNKQYVQIFPRADTVKLQAWSATFTQNENVFSSAFWMYSDKEGYLRYAPDEYILDLNQRQLFSGWNFVALTPEFTQGKSLGELKGSCNIIKAYIYISEITLNHPTPSWLEVPPNGSFSKDAEGKGMIVKVSGDCKLGQATPITSITAPPSLPA